MIRIPRSLGGLASLSRRINPPGREAPRIAVNRYHVPEFPLHKYLYADGDPVNGFDPTGRGDSIVEYAQELGADAKTVAKLYLARVKIKAELIAACIPVQISIYLLYQMYQEVPYDVVFEEASAYCTALLAGAP
jgi:hypothetical protein